MSFESHEKYLAGMTLEEKSGAMQLNQHPGLPAFLRALLVADGTVTLLLQAYFDEPVSIEMCNQMPVTISAALPVLGLQAGDKAFFRQVRLIGQDTGSRYALASSLLNPSRIHPKLFQELINEEVGLGEVLRNAARGSFREVLDISRLSPETVCRTYAVFVDQLPAILITEMFSIATFQGAGSSSLDTR